MARKLPHLSQKRPSGRPMANSGGLKRQIKRIRSQIKQSLQRGSFDSKGL